MLGLTKLAVTGGLSSGKSSVCRLFKELGAYVVSADKIVHQLLSSDETLIREVIKLLGQSIYVNKKIERSAIASFIFKDETLLHAFEELLHPRVYKEIEEAYKSQCFVERRPPLFVAEVPLLFETAGETYFDLTLAVVADRETSIKRFVTRTGYDEKEFTLRSNHQFSPEKKAELADYRIINEGSLEALKKSVEALYKQITSLS